MNSIEDILTHTSHRPFDLPEGKWAFYQEWNKALFLHWAIPFEILRKSVPSHLNPDTFDGDCYISLVAFTMQKIRPRFFPPISFISDFDEINVRTYIDNDNKKGVYFLNIEAGKSLSAFIAKAISGLPYEKSIIHRTDTTYHSRNKRKGFSLDTAFEVKDVSENKTELDKWLTERYCLYLDEDNACYRYDVHHKEWILKAVQIKHLDLNYSIGEINLNERPPDLSHYSEGIKVLAWNRQKI